MILSAQKNLGIGVSSPSARLHTNGSLRFQNIATTTSGQYLLTADSNGNVKRQLASTISGGEDDIDWLDLSGNTPNSISDNIYTNGDVGINTSSPTRSLDVNGRLRVRNLPIVPVRDYALVVASGNGDLYVDRSLNFKKLIDKIDAQEDLINRLQGQLNQQQSQIETILNKTASIDSETMLDKKSYLVSNMPNPFSNYTEIPVFINEGATSATIIISSLTGSRISSHNVNSRGNIQKITVEKNSLSTGTYIYSLVVDGKIVDSKKMIVK